MFSLHSFDVDDSKHRLSGDAYHMHALRTMEGACVSINQGQSLCSRSVSWPLLVSMRLEYKIHINLLIVVKYCGGILEKWRINSKLIEFE